MVRNGREIAKPPATIRAPPGGQAHVFHTGSGCRYVPPGEGRDQCSISKVSFTFTLYSVIRFSDTTAVCSWM